jgi:hypothetical protein
MDSYSSKHALLSNVIDYAGNFPPAALPLDEAMNRAATFRKTARHPWLMGRLTSKWSDIKTFHPPRLFNSWRRWRSLDLYGFGDRSLVAG